MDITTITTAWEGLKSSKEFLGILFDAKVDAEAQAKIRSAMNSLGKTQDTLFELREELFRLQDANNELRRQLAEAQSWEGRIGRYELAQTPGGAIVYQFMDRPEHFACPSCVNKRELHILQDNRTRTGKFRCTGCGSEFPIEPRQALPPLDYSGGPWPE